MLGLSNVKNAIKNTLRKRILNGVVKCMRHHIMKKMIYGGAAVIKVKLDKAVSQGSTSAKTMKMMMMVM